MTAQNTGSIISAADGDTVPAASTRRRARLATAAVTSVAGTAVLALAVSAIAPAAAMAATATVPLNCAAAPSKCGYPDATNSGVPAGTVLKTVPAQVSSGPGWTSSSTGSVHVTGNGAVLSGLSITGNLDISASNVTIKNVKVVTGGNFGISLRHTTGVTIQNSTVSGADLTTGRVNSAIDDVYGDSTGMVIKANNISAARTGIQVSSGMITGNYIHDPGYISGDHVNGIYVNGGTAPMTISGNTIFNNFTQTDDVNLDASGDSGQAVANKTVTGNLLAGGGYSVYGGNALAAVTSNIVITNNRFSTRHFAKGGLYGAGAYFTATAPGSSWSGNFWDSTGSAVPAP